MTDKQKTKSLIYGSTVYLLSNIVNAVIPFALLPILTRYLSPEEYGEVAMFQALLGALGAIVGLNVAGAAVRRYYDENADGQQLKQYITACLQILMLSCGGMFFIMYLLHEQFAAWLSLNPKWILWAVLTSAALVVIQLRLGQWQVREQPNKYAAMQVSQSLMNFSLSLIFVVVLLEKSDGRIQGLIFASIVIALVALISLKRDDLIEWSMWNTNLIKDALRFGVPLIPHVAGGFLLGSADRFVINAELGLADAGLYMVAVQFAASVSLVFDAINKAYVPWLFEKLRRDSPTEKRQVVLITYIWFVILIIGVIIAFLVGPYLVTLVAGERYTKSGELIGWLVMGQAFTGMYLMVTNYIFYAKRTGLLSVVTISTGLLNVGLLVLLVNLIGMKGAAIASSVALGIRFVLTWWIAQKTHPMPWLLGKH